MMDPAQRPPAPARRIIITGGSSGIGQAIARRLSTPEVTVVNLDRADGRETSRLCGGVFHTIRTEMGDAVSIASAFREADEVFAGQPPDLLVCCAALSRATPFLEVTLEELDGLLGVNVRGTFLVCQEAAGRMRPAGAGRIVVITSVCALQGWAKEPVYCITKGAQQSLVQALAVELAPLGILVNAIAPESSRKRAMPWPRRAWIPRYTVTIWSGQRSVVSAPSKRWQRRRISSAR